MIPVRYKLPDVMLVRRLKVSILLVITVSILYLVIAVLRNNQLELSFHSSDRHVINSKGLFSLSRDAAQQVDQRLSHASQAKPNVSTVIEFQHQGQATHKQIPNQGQATHEAIPHQGQASHVEFHHQGQVIREEIPNQGQATHESIPHQVQTTQHHNLKEAATEMPRPMSALLKNASYPYVNVVPSEPASNWTDVDCVPLPECSDPRVKICLHTDEQDGYISGSLRRNTLWERHLIKEMETVLLSNQRLTLVDLGCNIGQYTLWAAALGRRVLAVEMLMENVVKLQTSLKLSRLGQLVTIVNNAIYKDRRVLGTKFVRHNFGGNRLNTSNVFEPLDSKHVKVKVKTICMDDLVPLVGGQSVYLKMDIENSEHDALQCADAFFRHVDVRVLQMEWMDKTLEEKNIISGFLSKQGYVPSESASRYSPPKYIDYAKDVFYLKNDSIAVTPKT
ncbi:uncharacterized protein LOC131937532 [Physella acuta]|uniref:uncharacterized protein LOC131937532 n=1 Tax=Physella acuta TaxID=109671 RepID=UPI0027DDA9D5|nr:uncharacterized protein LOC131937532 [Physella acuta]